MSRHIVDIAEDIENELISQLYACEAYALQMDESTDVAGPAILFVLIRHDIKKLKTIYFLVKS